MQVDVFIHEVKDSPESIDFEEVISVIEQSYFYTPTAFANGGITNLAGENEGSCKIFAFAKLHDLTKEQTLSCFGKYYREDVLNNPAGNDHQNIRNFMQTGWEGINFVNDALVPKS